MATTPDQFRQIVSALPEVVEGSHVGAPAYYVGKSFFTRIRDDDQNVLVPMEFGERDFWIAQEPAIFHMPARYAGWRGVFVRLAEVEPERLDELLRGAWVMVAKPAVRKRHPEMTAG